MSYRTYVVSTVCTFRSITLYSTDMYTCKHLHVEQEPHGLINIYMQPDYTYIYVGRLGVTYVYTYVACYYKNYLTTPAYFSYLVNFDLCSLCSYRKYIVGVGTT